MVGGSQSAAADTSVTGIELPPGFYLRTSIGGLVAPTDMSFMPDGDLLVTEKGGGVDEFGLANVRVVISETVVVTPVLTLSVNATGDSGLLSLALDPAFAANGYFYLYYAIGAGRAIGRARPTTGSPASPTMSPPIPPIPRRS